MVDEKAITRFLHMLFEYAQPGGAFQIRGLNESTQDDTFMDPQWCGVPVEDHEIAQAAKWVAHHVERWGTHKRGSFILPATLKPESFEQRKAGEAMLATMGVVMVDLDTGDTDAGVQRATELCGRPTMVVRSGGVTKEGFPKRHLYWRLSEHTDDLVKATRIRLAIAQKVNGDVSFKRMTQIIRIPGSLHSKGTPTPVTIESFSPSCEYELDDLTENLGDLPSLDERIPAPKNPSAPGQGAMDFAGAAGTRSIKETLTEDVHAGGGDNHNRHGELTKVIGYHIRLVRMGALPYDEAKTAAREYMDLHVKPPYPQSKFDYEWDQLVKVDEQAHGGASLRAVAAQPPMSAMSEDAIHGADDLLKWSPTHWAMGDPPPRRFLVDGMVRAGQRHILAADGGVGKTFMSLELALACASYEAGQGTAWLGSDVTPHMEGGRVVVLTAEDDKEELHIRLRDLDPDGSRIRRAGERLVIVPMDDAGGMFPLVETDRNQNPRSSERWELMLAAMEGIGDVRLVVIDTLASALHGDENNSIVVQELWRAAARACSEIGAALVLTHHVRKPGAGGAPILNKEDMRSAIRGSGSILNSCRVALGVWHAHDWEERLDHLNVDPQPNTCYRMAVVKANCPEMLPGLKTLVRDEKGFLVDRSADDRLDQMASIQECQWLLVAIRQAAERGVPFTRHGKHGVFERRGELPPSLGSVGKHRLSRLADTLLNRSLVVRTGAGYLDTPNGAVACGHDVIHHEPWPKLNAPWADYVWDADREMVKFHPQKRRPGRRRKETSSNEQGQPDSK